MINGDELLSKLDEFENRIADIEAQVDALLKILGNYISFEEEEEEEGEESWIDAALSVDERDNPIIVD